MKTCAIARCMKLEAGKASSFVSGGEAGRVVVAETGPACDSTSAAANAAATTFRLTLLLNEVFT